jgi:hypothetical protein
MLSAPLAKISGDKSALAAEITIGSRTVKVLHVGKFYPPHRGGIETHLQVLSDCKKISVAIKPFSS